MTSVNPPARNAPEHFREFRWIFTGTGRCGTGYVSKVLQSAGIRCGHEGVFNRAGWEHAAHLMRYGHWEADSSWLAAPWLPRIREEFPDVRIIHLVRHPRDVIADWLANGVFTGEFGPWLRWAMRFLPLGPVEDQLDAAAWYFCEWTRLVEKSRIDFRWRVEDDPRGLLDVLGIDHAGRELFSNKKYNYRAEVVRVPDLRELREPWRSTILEWCGEWGYDV